MAASLNIIVLLSLTVGICAGEYCSGEYCEYGCCQGDCCMGANSSLSIRAFTGIIFTGIILKFFFWVCCCFFVRRRRQTVLIQHVMTPQTTTVLVNRSHIGYDQHRPIQYPTPMPGPMLNGQYIQQQTGSWAPPPYEQPSTMPPMK